MRLRDRVRAHPVGAAILAALTLPIAIVSAGGVIESAWSLISNEPLIPWAGGWLRRSADDIAQLFLLVGFASVVLWMLFVQYKIFRVLNRPYEAEELPGDLQQIEGVLNAGTDFTLLLNVEGGRVGRSVTFSARQGERIVARNQRGRVNAADNRYELPLKAEQTRKLKTGYLLAQATVITDEGHRAPSSPVVVKTFGLIVS